MKKVNEKYDVIVIGGGMSGLCAAIASARHGAKTALVQNRPVLGGNASSEIRMHICGADYHASRPDARETGIIEEILLDNRVQNPQNSFSILDTVMWEKANFQEGLTLYLNTHMISAQVKNNEIKAIIAHQLTTEKVFSFEADIFIDATGDGMLAELSGAQYMSGREGKDVFGEQFAPEQSDDVTMGNSLLFRAVDTGKPVKFRKPFWANTYNEENLAFREHTDITSGYWWIELGGDDKDIISEGEEVRDDLLKAVYGIWDHIKNSGHHNAENFVLDWVGFLPGKRESRRIIGDYVLKEMDCWEGRIFDDAVAYGGWPMDMHVVGGLKSNLEPTNFILLKDVYTIPYRCLYSKNIKNLMLGGRAISASHMAFGSTRVMATCAVLGQAGGTAAAIAIKKNILPSGVLQYIDELQQELLKDDCYIPGVTNTDEKDIAKIAKISCSSEIEGGECENIINGITRREKENSNCWISDEVGNEGEWVSLKFNHQFNPKELHFKFDSNLSKEIMVSLSHKALANQIEGVPPELVKDYCIEFYSRNKLKYSESVTENHLRHRIHKVPVDVACDEIKVKVSATNGDKHARIFEMRVY